VIEWFLGKRFDRVVTISTHFRSTLKQETLVRQVLPVSIDKIKEVVDEIVPTSGKFSELGHEARETKRTKTDYIFEPTATEALSALIPHLIEMQLLHLVLEANASEHSARMVAMKSASDNAKELSTGLQLEYNKARQAGITKEIIEITSTQAALG
jgi:F-type H+-transporting ATPase subunit gamma